MSIGTRPSDEIIRLDTFRRTINTQASARILEKKGFASLKRFSGYINRNGLYGNTLPSSLGSTTLIGSSRKIGIERGEIGEW
jgi:hypothetical protein